MKKLIKKLNDSPINYFSDLFIVAMVAAWIITIFLVSIFAVYATIEICDTSVWSYLVELVTVPLSAGGAIWMIKNAVQHAIANKEGHAARMDFPKVEGTEDVGIEAPINPINQEEDNPE